MTTPLRSAVAACAALVLLTATACGPADLSAEREALRPLIGRARPESSFHVGGFLLGLARHASKEDGDEEAGMIGALRSVDIEVYAVKPGAASLAHTPAVLPGWEPIVRAKDKDGFAQVLVKTKHDRIQAMLVVAQDEHEIALIRIDGEVETLVQQALRDRGDGDREGAVMTVASNVRHDAASHRQDAQ